jgi:hypothetical protein
MGIVGVAASGAGSIVRGGRPSNMGQSGRASVEIDGRRVPLNPASPSASARARDRRGPNKDDGHSSG